MKKQVIFAIVVIYLISIAVVTFFGTQISITQFPTYISHIQITNYDFIDANGDKWLEITYDPTQSYASKFIQYTWQPDDASYPSQIAFAITNASYTDPDSGYTTTFAGVRGNGEVYFQNLTRSRTVTVKVYATDGPKSQDNWDEILVRCLVN